MTPQGARAPERRRPVVPELMGASEAAETIGVYVQNLTTLAGMPEPVATLRATRIWLADEVREFAADYQSRSRVQSHRKGKGQERRNGAQRRAR
jgi:hypothetical protein